MELIGISILAMLFVGLLMVGVFIFVYGTKEKEWVLIIIGIIMIAMIIIPIIIGVNNLTR